MDPYAVLGVTPDSSQENIKKAYRKLAMKHHPDQGGDAEKFKEINAAWQLLKPAPRPHQDFNPDTFAPDLDFFRDYFRMNQRRNRPPSEDKDIWMDLRMNIKAVRDGREQTVTYHKAEDCEDCAGIGAKEKKDCEECKGAGMKIQYQPVNATSGYASQTICHVCKGIGAILIDECKTCDTKGFNLVPETLTFEIKEKVDKEDEVEYDSKVSGDLNEPE